MQDGKHGSERMGARAVTEVTDEYAECQSFRAFSEYLGTLANKANQS